MREATAGISQPSSEPTPVPFLPSIKSAPLSIGSSQSERRVSSVPSPVHWAASRPNQSGWSSALQAAKPPDKVPTQRLLTES